MFTPDIQSWINFATPIAIIVAAVLQRLATNHISNQTMVLDGKVDQVHQLTNDRMSKMVAKVEELQAIINQQTSTHLDEKFADIKQTILAKSTPLPVSPTGEK